MCWTKHNAKHHSWPCCHHHWQWHLVDSAAVAKWLEVLVARSLLICWAVFFVKPCGENWPTQGGRMNLTPSWAGMAMRWWRRNGSHLLASPTGLLNMKMAIWIGAWAWQGQIVPVLFKMIFPYKMENAIQVVAEWLELACWRRPNGRWHLSGPLLQQADVHPFWQKWRLGWCTALLDWKHNPKATADVTAERHGKNLEWCVYFLVMVTFAACWSSWFSKQIVKAHVFCGFGKFDEAHVNEAHVNEALVLAAYKAHASAFV